MIVERRSLAPPGRVSLPEAARSALAAISSDLRDLPRDCVRDPAELLFWLRRMARRVEGVAEMTAPKAAAPAPRTRIAIGRRPSPREVAEAVFAKRTPPRTITTRTGRTVRVETRHGPARQIEMEF